MRDQERNWISQHQRSAFTKTFRNFALACWIYDIWLHPKGYNPCLQGLHGIDVITPGTSTVGYVQDYNKLSFARFQSVLNTASDKRLLYVLTLFPPIARLLPRKLFGLLSFQLGVGCLFVCIERIQIGIQTWEPWQI